MQKYIYISVEKAFEIHDYLLRNEGGLEGVIDAGQVESILIHIQNDEYYPTFYKKITHLIFSFINFHCFADGNKRTALALGAYFLDLNFTSSIAEKFIQKMENIVVEVAKGKISKNLLQKIIENIFEENEDNEELLSEIYNSLK